MKNLKLIFTIFTVLLLTYFSNEQNCTQSFLDSKTKIRIEKVDTLYVKNAHYLIVENAQNILINASNQIVFPSNQNTIEIVDEMDSLAIVHKMYPLIYRSFIVDEMDTLRITKIHKNPYAELLNQLRSE